jgi:alpha/beta superfamily hydrolase
MVKSLLKIVSEYLIRICVFQVGEYKRGPFSRYLIRSLKKHYDLSDRFINLNPEYIDSCVKIFEELGGIRYIKDTPDGLAKIDYMLLTVENVQKRIEQKGGKWIEIAIFPPTTKSVYQTADDAQKSSHYIYAIFAENETPEWGSFFHNVLCMIGWERATLEFQGKTKEILVTSYRKGKHPERNHACFMRCHSPGRSYGMDKKYISRHLSARKDLCLFDYRGTHKSIGTPSEGGYYLDAEAIFHELLQRHSYQPQQIWVTGFCLGGAVAAFLKVKYHDLGIHYVGENTFTSLLSVIDNQIQPFAYMGRIAIHAIKTLEASITSRVEQDEFNTLEKFSKIKSERKNAICVFINTDADTILPKNSGEKLYSSASKTNTAFQITHISTRRNNPHVDHVFDEDRVWDKYLEIIS